MGQVKKVIIKNRSYYFCDDMINIKNFYSNLLKIDKKSHKDINIYYIGYIMIKQFSDCEKIRSINLLYLIFNNQYRPATGHFLEKYGEKYLTIDLTEKYESVWSGIKSKVETFNGGKELFYEKSCAIIGINTDDDLSLNKKLKFPTLTIIIRCVLEKDEKLYP